MPVDGPLTYVFCLVEDARRPTAPTRARARGASRDSLPGAGPVRALAAGDDLWLIVADVPAREYSEAAVTAGLRDLDWVGRRAIAHEAVVEHFLRARAVLPFKMFAIFTSDARALEDVRRRRRAIDRALERVRGKVEWGLRLTLEDRAADPPRRRVLSGTAYLARKRDRLDIDRAQLRRARRDTDRLYRALRHQAAASVRRDVTERAPGSKVLLDAAFLVPKEARTAFRTLVRAQVKGLRAGGLAASVTGPWPPYNFIGSRAKR